MDAGRGRRRRGGGALLCGYAAASLALIALHPFLPGSWGDADLLLACVGAAASVAYGRRTVRPAVRRPWTLLLWALAVLVAGNLVALVAGEYGVAAGWILDAAGNVLVLAVALDLIVRRGAHDLGGVIDAIVIALAAGSLLWVLLPHRLGRDESLPAQLNLFIVVFALTGVLGALVRLAHPAAGAGSAAWWLLSAISLAIAGNVMLSVGGEDPALLDVATMLFVATFTAVGLFGLDPNGPGLAEPRGASPERLSIGRLVFLCAAVAAIPVVIGTRDLLAGDVGGLLLAMQGALVAALVMARVGLLSAQRTRAERTLEHQATHDLLTHLPNRRQFVTRLRDHLSRDARCVLLFCDVDNFKLINDKLGHDAGDALLAEVAHRLRTSVGPPHTVSRFGGDEFVVLLVDVTPDERRATEASIAAALRRPFDQVGRAEVGVSIGVAQSDGERDPDRLINNADRAMYRVKQSRKGSPARHRAPGIAARVSEQ